MRKAKLPSREELEIQAKVVPGIRVPEILAMLRIMQTAEEIQHSIVDRLEKEHQISEGKLRTMILLYRGRDGLTPSVLAEHAGVSRATMSVMLQRMVRDGLVRFLSNGEDGRSKQFALTDKGKALMDNVLPEHYLRITKVMGRLTEAEQEELIGLLKKLAG